MNSYTSNNLSSIKGQAVFTAKQRDDFKNQSGEQFGKFEKEQQKQ